MSWYEIQSIGCDDIVLQLQHINQTDVDVNNNGKNEIFTYTTTNWYGL
jgi:hypothetical protein